MGANPVVYALEDRGLGLVLPGVSSPSLDGESIELSDQLSASDSTTAHAITTLSPITGSRPSSTAGQQSPPDSQRGRQ